MARGLPIWLNTGWFLLHSLPRVPHRPDGEERPALVVPPLAHVLHGVKYVRITAAHK